MGLEANIPNHILERMSPEDRVRYGHVKAVEIAGGAVLAQTSKETLTKGEEEAERTFQKQVVQYLNLLGVEHINPPMNRKSILPEGWPDFTLAYKGVPVALECKTATNRVRPEQNKRIEALRANGWRAEVVRSLDEVKEILRSIDFPNGKGWS